MNPILLASLILASVFSLSADDGWVDFFGDDSTDGWTPRAEVETFEVKDGVVHLLATNNVWVVSDIEMSDF